MNHMPKCELKRQKCFSKSRNVRKTTIKGYNLDGCCSASAGMKTSSKNPIETVKEETKMH